MLALELPPGHYFDSTGLDFLTKRLPLLFPDLCEVIELPHQTLAGYTVLAVRVGRQQGRAKNAVLLTGNVHARELGGSEFCLYLAFNLCRAYKQNDGLLCGGRTITAAEIGVIIENLDLVMIPCVNPDGRDHSLYNRYAEDWEQALWRGNRNLVEDCPRVYGVDLNRNQDFLWDFQRYFAGTANVQASTSPCYGDPQYYRGPAVASEPETRNLVWLMDRYPSICAYLDIHCSYGAILYPWGDDHSQDSEPDKNFRNPAYDGLRDPHNPDYGEYMPAADRRDFQRLAGAFRDSLRQVRGTEYQVMPSVELDKVYPNQYGGTTYKPTSGANDDYAYSRHFSDASKGKIYAFSIEFGQMLVQSEGDDVTVGGFQPPMTEMSEIIKELIAGTVGFCVEVDRSVPSPFSILVATLAVVLVAIIGILISQC